MKQKILVKETLERTVEVEAENQIEAQSQVEKDWNEGKIVLNADDFSEVEFSTVEQQEQIKVVLVKVKEKPEVVMLDRGLSSLQEAVGGYIQAVYPFEDEVAIVCNDEGKLNGMGLNRAIYSEDGNIQDIIAGDFFICSTPIESENFESLSDEQVKKYQELFKYPEEFYKGIDGIKAIQIKSEKCQER